MSLRARVRDLGAGIDWARIFVSVVSRESRPLVRAIIRKWRPLGSVALLVGAAILYLYFGNKSWHSHAAAGAGSGPDATALISTLIVIYTFFIAAYGALAPSFIGTRRFGSWQLAALLLMLGAVGLDLGRVWNSIGDMYATTMRNLPPNKVDDAAAEFKRYLLINVVVLIFALAVVCGTRVPDDAKCAGDSRGDAPR